MTQTVNRYMYVNAKPINYCDPSGLGTFAIGLTGSLGASGGIIDATIPIYHSLFIIDCF